VEQLPLTRAIRRVITALVQAAVAMIPVASAFVTLGIVAGFAYMLGLWLSWGGWVPSCLPAFRRVPRYRPGIRAVPDARPSFRPVDVGCPGGVRAGTDVASVEGHDANHQRQRQVPGC